MTEQEVKEIENYHHFATQFRGRYINEVVGLERMIDYFIACHLCHTQEKQQEICELILGTERMTFGGKKQVFEALRNRYYKEDEKTTQKISKLLKDILSRRNRFAHVQLSLSLESAEHYKNTGEITFVHYTNGIDFHRYDKNRLQKYFDEIFECRRLINEMNQKKA